MKNFSLFLVGLGLMVFAGMFHLYRHGLNEAKKAPTPPPQPQAESPKSLEGPEVTGKVPPKDDSIKQPSSPPPEIVPEIKTANLVDNLDPVIGKSDLKNP